jgi:hypothetical protein
MFMMLSTFAISGLLFCRKNGLSAQKGIIPFNLTKDGEVIQFVQDQTRRIGCDWVVITASSQGLV